MGAGVLEAMRGQRGDWEVAVEVVDGGDEDGLKVWGDKCWCAKGAD